MPPATGRMLELDAVNVNLIRFSDVLLWDAECEVLPAILRWRKQM